MKIGKIGVVVIGLVPFNVYAEPCTPAPDCTSIGYTETSCEGDSLKCPFDITKLYCIPCDSSFKYTCSGENVKRTIGSACDDKYVSCECIDGAIFSNGNCICDTSCKVGYIYYSDGTCSSCVKSNKTAIGVVVKDNALVMSWEINSDIKWGTQGTDITDLPNIASSTDAKADFNGKGNTTLIVAFQTIEGKTAANSAAMYCNEYAPTGMESSKGQWYLPAVGELYKYVYKNYDTLLSILTTHLGYSSFSYWFWSSTEVTNSNSWYVGSDRDYVGGSFKSTTHSVVCFFALQ